MHDVAMRLGCCAGLVEQLHPRAPRSAGRLLDSSVTHSGNFGVIDFFVFDDVQAGAGVRLARLLHPGTNDSFEVFLFRHHDLLRSRRERSSPAATAATTKVRHTDPGVCPPLPRKGSCWGRAAEVGRGSAPGEIYRDAVVEINRETHIACINLTVTRSLRIIAIVVGFAEPTFGTCPTMIAGMNVFMAYSGQTSGCSQSTGSCSVGETISFSAASFGYDFSCATHTYSWNFGDGGTGSGANVNHAYSSPAT